ASIAATGREFNARDHRRPGTPAMIARGFIDAPSAMGPRATGRLASRRQEHLRAAEERDRAVVGLAPDRRVPYLRGAAEVRVPRDARDRAVTRGAEKIGLELDRREVGHARRQ